VVVISSPEALRADADLIVVVAVSSTVLESEVDRVALPNRQETPQAKSGLSRPCWAVPRWTLPIQRSRLSDRAGYISGKPLKELLLAVERRAAEMDEI
jgi:hypothetical protein